MFSVQIDLISLTGGVHSRIRDVDRRQLVTGQHMASPPGVTESMLRKIDCLVELTECSHFVPIPLFLLIIVLLKIVRISNAIYIFGQYLEHLQLLDAQLTEILVELIK